MTYTIGFANFDENCRFSLAIQTSLSQAVEDNPNLNLITRYNNRCNEQALHNAREFAEREVDIVVMFHRHAQTLSAIRAFLFPIPMITIDVQVPLVTYFGRNNQRCGDMVGQAAIDWIQKHWQGRVDHIIALEDTRPDDATTLLIHSTLHTLEVNNVCKEQQVTYISIPPNIDHAGKYIADYLATHPNSRRIVAITYDTPTALLMLDVVREMGRAQDVIVLGHAADDAIRDELLCDDTPMLAASTCPADRYGDKLVQLIYQRLRGERVPAKNYITVELLQRVKA